MTERSALREVSIVGGGLGGLAAAFALSATGKVHVTLHEAGDRLGGMAGATKVDDHYEDHGYHIFPPWYVNLYGILDTLGIRGNLIDITRFHQLQAGEYPRFRPLENFTSMRYAFRNLTSGSIPFWDLLLYYYSVGDLLCQPYRHRAFLDQISVNAFVRSRFYRTESIATQYQDLLLKFISVPSYTVSAMTTQKMLSYWVGNGVPMHRILNADMHTAFIGPWEAKLRQLGCTIRMKTRLAGVHAAGGRVTSLEMSTEGAAVPQRIQPDDVILALPARRLAPLVGDEVYAADRELASVKYLNAEAMGSLSLYLDRRVDGLPPEHVNLIGSRFSLTLIDVSQHWSGLEKTVLNVIASDMTELQGISDAQAEREIVAELTKYLPFLGKIGIERSYFQPHFNEPLVMNDVGAWRYRPNATTHLENLYLAGTHCRSHVDMTSMEGATVTGLQAANALLERNGLGPVWKVRKPVPVSRLLMHAIRVVAFPFAVLGKAWLSVRDAGRAGREP